MVMAVLRMCWYCLSVNVCAGATVTESPVCTPIGSTFSIAQMMMTLSFASRKSSSSNSFQPKDAFFYQHFVYRRHLQSAPHLALEL